jgi:hypothetical protein
MLSNVLPFLVLGALSLAALAHALRASKLDPGLSADQRAAVHAAAGRETDPARLHAFSAALAERGHLLAARLLDERAAEQSAFAGRSTWWPVLAEQPHVGRSTWWPVLAEQQAGLSAYPLEYWFGCYRDRAG